MKIFSLLSLLLFSTAYLLGQNLVPNPSFEAYNKKPNRWSGHSGHFNDISKHWMSPNQGSPDVLWEEAMHKLYPTRKGISFVGHHARTGDKMIGIKTYGCNAGIMQCREYVEVKLQEPLIPCAKYYIEFWLNPVAKSIKVNNFGAAILEKPLIEPYAELLEGYDLVLNESEIVEGKPNEWHKVSGTFVADSPGLFLVIGNFYTDEETKARPVTESVPYAFYLLDDVLLKQIPNEDPLACLLTLPPGETLILENVYFDHNKYSIQATSFPVLEQLVALLLERPSLALEIQGHTDDTGTPAFNMELSEQRAKAVVAFLVNAGIDASRLAAKGFGTTQAIADNEGEAGRQLNRRVEIKVLAQ